MHSNPHFDPKASYCTSWFSYRLTKIEQVGLAWHGTLYSPGNTKEWAIVGASFDALKKAAEGYVVNELANEFAREQTGSIPENVFFDIDTMKAKYDF